MIDPKPPAAKPQALKSEALKPKPLAWQGLAGAIDEQCDDLEKKRVEQTDKMRLLLLKLGKTARSKTDKS